MQVVGKYAYVTYNVGGASFFIYDVSNPASPVGAGGYLLANPTSVRVVGKYAYILYSNNNLAIYDVSSPASASLVSSTQIASFTTAKGMAISGKYLYVVGGGATGKLQIVDITNPNLPTMPMGLAGFATSGNTPIGVTVRGKYAYVTNNIGATGGGAFQIFDISNPITPVQKTSGAGIALGGNTNSGYLEGKYLYFPNGSTLYAYDIDNPTSPTLYSSTVAIGGSVALQDADVVSGRYIYASTASSINVANIANPTSATAVGSIATGGVQPNAIAVQGRYLYAMLNNTITVYDLGGSYIQQFEAGSSELSNLRVTNSTTIGGELNVASSIVTGGTALLNGGLSVSGQTTIKAASGNDTITAVQIQNGAGTAFFNADTTNQRIGIQNNSPSFSLHVGSASVGSGTTVARFQNAGGTCDITPNVAGGITCTSDIRFKKNISDYSNALAKLTSLRTVSYNLNSEADGSQLHVGFIAQELETILPDLVLTDMDGFKSVSYAGLTPYLVAALQEQQTQVNALQGSIGLLNGGTINGSLNVTGPVSLAQDLAVTGNVFIAGNLTVVDISAENITVNGHLITAGAIPQIVALPAAGTAASASIDGNDTAGTITVVAGANTVAGDFVDVIFNTPFTKPPKVLLNAGNDKAADLKFYREADTTKFRIKLLQQPSADQTYVLDYFIVQ
jgi:hypothetical protein